MEHIETGIGMDMVIVLVREGIERTDYSSLTDINIKLYSETGSTGVYFFLLLFLDESEEFYLSLIPAIIVFYIHFVEGSKVLS